MNGAKRNPYRILVGKPEGKRLGRPRNRQVDNIKMDLRQIEWIDRDQWRTLVNTVIFFGFIKCWEVLE
jgi:hypothetical protein